MPLHTGAKLGPYEILGAIGAGGMGEVYRATDTNLARQVAIKVLPEAVASDPERLARFDREAKTLAALNHPSIAQIYGLERADGQTALVMELVEGPTVADRIAHLRAQGASAGQAGMPVDEALPIAKQIAEALEAAHERGIIHRDLKPANVKVRPDGTVKVLDFGLAKALDAERASAAAGSASMSPTITTPAMTAAGMILGTAAYMSPEQARGKPVDKSTDIWAFGCVLYEMLAGQRAFAGEEVSDVLASVLRSEPDASILPRTVSTAVRHVLDRCLAKDRKQRFRDIGDVLLALGDAMDRSSPDEPPAGPAGVRRARLAWAAIAVLALAVVVLGVSLLRRARVVAPGVPIRSSITLAAGQRLIEGTLEFSPDGATLAFVAQGEGPGQICLRALDNWEVHCLERTVGARNPFFSPDGRQVAYFSDNGLWAISSAGGSPIRLASPGGVGGSWARDGSIVFNQSYNQGLVRIAAPGEAATVLTMPDTAKGELGHFWPQVLPDDNTVIFTIFSPRQSQSHVAALRLDTGEVTPLVADAVRGQYLSSGHLVFIRSNNLMAVRFDPARLQTIGAPVPVLEDVNQNPGDATSLLAFADTGTLAYVPDSVLNPQRNLAWVDPQGAETPVPDIRGSFHSVALSPDETRVAVTEWGANPDIYVFDLESGRGTRLTFGEASEDDPVWAPDGRSIAYLSDRPPYDLFRQTVDRSGSEELLLASAYDKTPDSFSPDGSTLVFHESRPDASGQNLWLLPLTGTREPRPFLQTPFNEANGVVSPGGTLMAHVSNETGQAQVVVDTFPERTRALPVSIDGGREPHWARDGRTLFYRSGRASFQAVDVSPGPPVRLGRPRTLFEKPALAYDVAADGRFLIVSDPDAAQARRIDIVQNWIEDLKRLVPTD
jgi:Tol biopolymer transport system component